MNARVFACVFVCFCAFDAGARTLWSKNDESGSTIYDLELDSAAKLSPLLAVQPAKNDPDFAALLRVRAEPTFKLYSWKFDAAYDNQLYFVSSRSLSTGYALPLISQLPFRIWQLAYTAEFGNFLDFQQLDRAFVSVKAGPFDITAGRQAIGLGRGVLFSALDIFAPFSPLQIDQEWRSGVDAFNVDWRVLDTISLQAIVTGGESFDDMAILGRVRGYLKNIDFDVLAAKRARDIMIGASTSLPVGDMEVHGEMAVFKTPEGTPNTGIFGDIWVPKWVVGFSNNFQVGNGLYVALEYHYSGFGARVPADLATLLVNPAFIQRLSRGDTQIIGAQALALSAHYELNTNVNLSLAFLQSLIDSSGVLAPSVTWDFAQFGSLLATAFVAYGATPQAGNVQSQFGSTPTSLIVQLRLYD